MRNHWLRWTSWRSPGTDLAACVSRVSPLITHLVIWTCSSGFWILLVCWCKKSFGLLSSVAFWTSQGRVQEFKKLRAIFISLQTEKPTIQELFIKIITDYILDSDKTGIPFCLPLTSLPSFWSFSQKSCCTCLYSSLLNTGNHRHTKVKQLRLKRIWNNVNFITAWLHENKGSFFSSTENYLGYLNRSWVSFSFGFFILFLFMSLLFLPFL